MEWKCLAFEAADWVVAGILITYLDGVFGAIIEIECRATISVAHQK